MNVIAKARHMHLAPRKARLLAGLIRGRDIASARRQLQVSEKGAASIFLKLLNSAAANAHHNFQLNPDILRVSSIVVDGGPIIYRFRPRAQGRSAPIRKHTSHITLTLSDAVPVKKEAPAEKTAKTKSN